MIIGSRILPVTLRGMIKVIMTSIDSHVFLLPAKIALYKLKGGCREQIDRHVSSYYLFKQFGWSGC
jgi:hypothetical protein